MNVIKYIALAVVAFAAATAYSQKFRNSPNDTIEFFSQMEDMETLTITQSNISSDTITLKWQKVSADVPAGWEASVCDNVYCYTSLVDSGRMYRQAPAEAGFLLLHITGHVNYGTAVVRYAVWDENDPVKRDTLTFIMHIYGAGTLNNFNTDFVIYPNPARDVVNIYHPKLLSPSFSIVDSKGRTIMNGELNGSRNIHLHQIPAGTYRIILSSGEYKYSKQLIIEP